MSVRVRFAPSPTGWLHVGGARTAYFNWLFARRHRGAFVVRIEDTDVERSSDASERGVLDDLRWLGLQWDEGPDSGGPHGPYRQSERLELYRRNADALMAQGLAYESFLTDEEIGARREAAVVAGHPPHAIDYGRDLPESERARLRAAGRVPVIRFRNPQREWTLTDLVHGEVRFPSGIVGDFVLLRSNGLPTYNFACVIDDADMRISHVLRAEEHLANSPRQLMLYDAFGWTAPRFAHVPLILNADRTKMSKREGETAVAVGDYRRAGYVADGLLSYMALLGFHPGDDREVLSRAELLEAFELERVGHSGSVFDPDKLRWTNAQVLHHGSGEQLEAWGGERDATGRPFVPAALAELPAATRHALLELVRGNLTTLADLAAELSPFLTDELQREADAQAALVVPAAARVCRALAEALAPLADWRAEAFKSALRSVGSALALKGADLYQPVRAALTGRTHGPELPRVAELLGKDRCLARLREVAGE